MIDYHIHTSFSFDCRANIVDVCRAALDKGLKYIAITDHVDIDDSLAFDEWNINDVHGINGYINSIKKVQVLFPKLNITFGLETGYTPSGYEKMLEIVDDINPDFIIGSIHFIDGYNIFFENYYKNKTKKQAFDRYLECVYDSIIPLSKYAHIIGHIGYICKAFEIPYDDTSMKYTDFKSSIDDILKSIIDNDLGIEINTSGLRSDAKMTLPDFDIICRYKKLGGNILTIGSDAHLIEQVGSYTNTAVDIAKSAGFNYLNIFEKGDMKFIKI